MPTFIEITNQMKKLRDPGRYPVYATRTFETQASPGIKAVMYKGTIQGEESEYPVYIQFRNVEFTKEEKPGTIPLKTTDKTGSSEMSFYVIPELNKNLVSLKCMCTDFRFMWEFPLYKAKSLIGQFRRYVRGPGVVPRGPKNPEMILGACKHIFSFVQALQNSKLVK
jgi:hypothetical protein